MSELDIKSSTLNKALDGVKDFLQKLVSPAVEEMGLLLADNVRMWRLRNQINNLEKVKKIVEQEKIDVKQVNLKVLIPYLDGVSLEEDEKLQDMWANLFTNYIDASKNLIKTVYPDVLRQLSSEEVAILKLMNENEGNILTSSRNAKSAEELIVDRSDLSNLVRLGIVEEESLYEAYDAVFRPRIKELQSDRFYLTRFGREFFKACSR